jgi:hypothetical protein
MIATQAREEVPPLETLASLPESKEFMWMREINDDA